jgi:hypothetical protein
MTLDNAIAVELFLDREKKPDVREQMPCRTWIAAKITGDPGDGLLTGCKQDPLRAPGMLGIGNHHWLEFSVEIPTEFKHWGSSIL